MDFVKNILEYKYIIAVIIILIIVLVVYFVKKPKKSKKEKEKKKKDKYEKLFDLMHKHFIDKIDYTEYKKILGDEANESEFIEIKQLYNSKNNDNITPNDYKKTLEEIV